MTFGTGRLLPNVSTLHYFAKSARAESALQATTHYQSLLASVTSRMYKRTIVTKRLNSKYLYALDARIASRLKYE
jgi:hypothetical protein